MTYIFFAIHPNNKKERLIEINRLQSLIKDVLERLTKKRLKFITYRASERAGYLFAYRGTEYRSNQDLKTYFEIYILEFILIIKKTLIIG